MIIEHRTIFFTVFFLLTLLVSFFVTKVVRHLAERFGIRDYPDVDRKIHRSPMPKLGGLAIYASFLASVLVLAAFGGTNEISALRIVGLLLGGGILIAGGILDDKYDLPAKKQIWFPVAAALLVVLSGTHISFITNPFGGNIILDQYKLLDYPVFGSLLVFGWILVIIYTTKFLDGMDGLVSGISGIAGLVIFGLSLAPQVNQSSTAFLALIFAAACFGFLPRNFFPAKIFLGEGGSTFTGFAIAVLAVISGAKIATALLVLGIPLLDAAWVIVRRLWFGASPFVADKKHLHFRLLDTGLTQRQAVVFLYALAAIFGGVAVFLQSLGKLVALIILGAVMLVVAMGVVILNVKFKNQNSK
ncbi:MAG: MraY family glycosyltransferase [bacterium]|nr:MraY family glycosyltransferase [bacterium]